MKKHNALACRLLDRQDDYLRFTQDRRIPPDNNGSERDIRMIKLRQKVSGCLRTLTGAKEFCANPQLPLHRCQTPPGALRHPRHAHRGPPLAACAFVITPRQPDQLPEQYVYSVERVVSSLTQQTPPGTSTPNHSTELRSTVAGSAQST
jgi:hypothetical protein